MLELDMYDNDSREMITFLKAREKKSNRRKEKIKLKTEGLNFGSTRLFFSFGIIILLIIITQTVVYVLLSLRARQVTQMVVVYTTGVDYWISFASIQGVLMQILLWNGQAKIWEEEPLKAYNIMKKRIQEVIIPNYEKSLNWNLGNFTKEHRDMVFEVIFFKNRIRYVKIC